MREGRGFIIFIRIVLCYLNNYPYENLFFVIKVASIMSNSRCGVQVSMSDFETNVSGSIFTKVLRFCRAGHLELKCCNAPIKVKQKCGGVQGQSALATSKP